MTRPPWLARVLAGLIRGPDAEVLRGDLEEAFQQRAGREGPTWRARLAYLGDVLASLTRWWCSGAWRQQEPRGNPNSGGLMRGLGTEVRQLWRGLLRRPGYAAIVALTLGLGMGATTTIYSVVDAMLVRALPYPDAERLVLIGNTVPGQEWVGARDGLQRLESMTLLNAEDLRRKTRGLAGIGAVERGAWLAADLPSGPELLQVANVTEGFFELFSVRPVLGRLLRREDYSVRNGDGGWGALISYQGWQRRFGGASDIVGKMLPASATSPAITIVGVLPRDFYQPAALVGSDVEFWLYLDPADRRYQDRRRRNVSIVASLAPGTTLERARLELAAAQTLLARDEPAGNLLPDGRPLGVGVNSLRDETIGSAGRPILVFLGAALLLLVLAGTNAANLLLVRGLEREGELAVRQALGAGRVRLGAGVVAESVLLALLGGVVGLGLGLAGVRAFHRFGPASLPRLAEVAVNPRIAAAGVLLAIGVGVSIGLLAAVRSSRPDLLASLRASLHSVTLKGTRLRSALAATQLALALMLGVGASLLFRSFVQLKTERLGFRPERLVGFSAPLKVGRPWEAWDQLVEALRAIPGVEQAAAASNLPFQTPGWTPRVVRADQTGETPSAGIPGYAVTPGFFATAGIPVLRGRSFNSGDQPESQAVAIVNQTFARAYFPDGEALGARIRLPDDRRAGTQARAGAGTEAAPELEIVGVVGDVVQGRIEDGIAPAIYVPHTQYAGSARFLVASRRELSSLGADIRRAMAGTAYAGRSPMDLSTLGARIASSRAGPRFQLLLIGGFAAAAVLLSAIGLYGTLAFTVRSRIKELGIRMAMGADQGMIYRLVLRQAMLVLGAGLAAGLLGALAVTRLLQGVLYRVRPIDPLSFLAATLVVAAAVLLAALRPASRAARIDPMASIRVEG